LLAVVQGFARRTSTEKVEAKQWPGDKEERIASASLSNSKVSCGPLLRRVELIPALQART
jgi:hypothetical protein